MKILLLNHHIDAQRNFSLRLQAAGAVLLKPSHPEEAWKMIQLHGPGLDLAIIHREGASDDAVDEGEKLIARIKSDPTQSDLPIILSSSLWNEADFFQHQQTAMGVNAYLRWPFTEDELIQTIETMFGNSIRFAAVTVTTTYSRLMDNPLQPNEEIKPPSAQSFSGMNVTLEEAPAESAEPNNSNLRLDIPSSVSGDAPGPSSGSELAGLSLDPPALEISADADQGAGSSEPALPDLVLSHGQESSMLQDLEPYERLEIDQQIKLSGGEEQPEGGTMVIDPASMGLQPAGSGLESNLEIAVDMPESETPVASSAPAIASTSSTPSTQVSRLTVSGGAGDEELASELPYLFNIGAAGSTRLDKKKSGEEAMSGLSSALVFAEPVGDAVIPGGAVQSPDVETLKRYLMLREQDVAVLSNQLKAARDQVSQFEKRLRDEAGKAGELEHLLSENQKRIEEFEKEKALALQGVQAELEELRFQNKAKTDKARLLESKVTEATDEIERLKERVRTDIRKIRVREKELENKLEIVRKDSEALITARESKIMELKRKIDLLEFNIDLLQDQNTREKENSAQLRERLAKAAQVVRVAGGLLDSQGKAIVEESASDKKTAREAS